MSPERPFARRALPLTLILALLTAALAVIVPSNAWAAGTFYVAPGGSDANSGSLTSPFATLTRARDAARAAGGGTVYVRGGTYTLTSPLTLDNRDSHTAYRAYQGEKVLVSGGKSITGTWTNKGAKGNGVHWTIPVANAASWNFRELYVDNQRLTRSRWPNDPRAEGDLGPVPSKPYPTMRKDFKADRSRISVAETIPSPNLAGTGAEFVIHAVWSEFRNVVVSSDAHNLHFAPKPGGRAVGMEQHYLQVEDENTTFNGKDFWPYNSYLENAFVFLDAQREWYLDKATGTLHVVLPGGSNPNNAHFIAPVAEKLVVAQGASATNPLTNLSFSGIEFAFNEWKLPASGYNEQQATHWVEDGNLDKDGWATYAMGHALQFTNTLNLTLDNIKVAHTGGGGVALGSGTRASRLIGSEIYDTGGTGVSVGWRGDTVKRPAGVDWADPNDVPANNVVSHNYIHDVGAMYVGGVGVWAGFARGTVISHNEIARGPYTGITVGWNWFKTPTSLRDTRIENNDIHHVMRTLTDGGGIYVLGRQPGARMTGNYLHDIHMEHYSKGWLANGIYFDQGSSGPWWVDKNVTADVPLIPLHYNVVMGVTMGESATYGTNWFDNRWPPTEEHGGPTYIPGKTYNVNAPPAEVANLIDAAGPAAAYSYLYDGETRNARSTIEAERFLAESGTVRDERCAEGGMSLGYIAAGNWTKYRVDFGTGVSRIDLRAATTASSGKAEIRVDSPTGPLLGTATVTSTGGWQTYTTTTQAVTGVTGKHDLYLVFRTTPGNTNVMNVNWFRFS
ncbi:carbohydrate-binding protein [Streptomyces sp. NPDC007818]|uniref:carbohydrate-binding protein n=1 Tax=Streptomyces sp. NPDC007818 TaxID=3364780 RepID=UPI0036768368